ncbi:MAG: phytanoyl-CoA dioxygenase family protein [Caldilineaceae bacterium]|nr:phytanoyl-CoA dioxygenase family protein [Caldilineaceae bacterium]MCB9147998.1 phytanoyl-CoA dioxygenase family protein [Caldilineaceae bacterium]
MLNEQQIALYQRNGFVNGGPVLDDETVEVLRAEVLRVIDERERTDIAQPVLCRDLNNNPASPIWQIVNIYEASPAFKALVTDSAIARMAAQLTDSSELRIWHDQIQYKPQAQGGRLHWHQDSPAWATLQPKNAQITAWVALDDADYDNGCMYMVPGSQNWGDRQPYLGQQPRDGSLPADFEGNPIYITMCPVKKGHVHFHHCLTWHGSGANVSNRPRRAIAIHYMTEKTVFHAAGEHPMKPFITVADGEKLVGDAFPLVWERG